MTRRLLFRMTKYYDQIFKPRSHKTSSPLETRKPWGLFAHPPALSAWWNMKYNMKAPPSDPPHTPGYALGVLGSVEELLGLGDVLRRLVDDALDVGHVEETLLDLLDHRVQHRLVDRQLDGQDLQRHLLDALGVCSLLWTAGGRRKAETMLRGEYWHWVHTWEMIATLLLRVSLNLFYPK